MKLRSAAATRRILPFSSLFAVLVTAGCTSQVLIGGEGGVGGASPPGQISNGAGGAEEGGASQESVGGGPVGEGGASQESVGGGPVGEGGASQGEGGASSGSGGEGGSTVVCYMGPCGDGIVDLLNDPHNCGACANECGPNGACSQGVCVSANGPCVGCAEGITPDANPDGNPLCQGGSQGYYSDLIDCVCNGACADVCGDNLCSCGPISEACSDCVTTSQTGCGDEFNTCANDI